jgi:phosphate/sulfate permease
VAPFFITVTAIITAAAVLLLESGYKKVPVSGSKAIEFQSCWVQI